MRQYITDEYYYDNRPVMGYNEPINVFIGGRGRGKTFQAQKFCLKQYFKKGRKFCWLRLKEPAVRLLLANDAKDFIDSLLLEKFKITGLKVKGQDVYVSRGDPDDPSSYTEMCRIMALSTFYQVKGVALNKLNKKEKEAPTKEEKAKVRRLAGKYRNIVLDEMNAEKSEKRTFDISYAFVNQIETICRQDTDRKLILCGNTLDEGSDILSNCFNFIPNDFGIYHIRRKRTIIHMISDSEKWKEDRAHSFAGLLMPEKPTFTNKVFSDIDLIVGKQPQSKQSMIIQFDSYSYYVLCGNVITKQKVSENNKLPRLALTPWIPGIPYDAERATLFIKTAQLRQYKFDMLLTYKKFLGEIKLLKN